MNIIVAVDENWAIGYKGELLISIKEDLQNFKRLTLEQNVVMGEITYESLPKRPLPNRTNIIITKDKNYKAINTIILHDVKDVVAYAEMSDKETFIIGGAQIYDIFIPYYKKAYITKIHHKFNADRHIKNFIDEKWKLIQQSVMFKTDDGFNYQFLCYEKILY